jgi:putative resolvase
LVVLEDGEVTGDLIGDMLQVLIGYCPWLYGRGSARNRTLKAMRWAQRDVRPAGVAGAAAGDGDGVVG